VRAPRWSPVPCTTLENNNPPYPWENKVTFSRFDFIETRKFLTMYLVECDPRSLEICSITSYNYTQASSSFRTPAYQISRSTPSLLISLKIVPHSQNHAALPPSTHSLNGAPSLLPHLPTRPLLTDTPFGSPPWRRRLRILNMLTYRHRHAQRRGQCC
jgi:hypothetical protein